MSEGAGKGDDPRPVNKRVWDESFDRIFNDHREPQDFQKEKTVAKKNDNNKS